MFSSYAYGVSPYYVCESGTGDGDTYETCMSPTYHNNTASFSSNDIIYLCDTITSQLIVPDSGTLGNNIVYDGSYPSHLGIIDAQGDNGVSGTGMIRLNDRDYITIQNLTMQDCDLAGYLIYGSGGSDINQGIVIDHVDFSVTESSTLLDYGMIRLNSPADLIISNCTFTGNMQGVVIDFNDSSHNDAYNIEFDTNTFSIIQGTRGSGIRFWQQENGVGSGTNTEGVVHDVNIHDNVFEKCSVSGITYGASSATKIAFITAEKKNYNINIVDNTFYRTELAAIEFEAISDRSGTKSWSNVSRNSITEIGYDLDGNQTSETITNAIQSHVWSQVIIEKNYIYKVYTDRTPGDGSGIILDWTIGDDESYADYTSNCIVRYNWIDTCRNKGIAAGRSVSNLIYSNIILNSGTGITIKNPISDGNIIYNNLIFGNDSGIYHDKDDDTQIIKNNIFSDNDYGIFAPDGNASYTSNPTVVPSESYNLFYDSATNHIERGTDGATSINATSIDDNPDFTTPGTDFTLQSTSPALDVGVILGTDFRYILDPSTNIAADWPDSVVTKMQGNLWNMGAYGDYYGETVKQITVGTNQITVGTNQIDIVE